MKTIRKAGQPTTARLETRDVRQLDDARAVLLDIANRVSDADDQEHMRNTAKVIEETIVEYTAKAEPEAAPAEKKAK
jgi:hypothetical protein